jgi:acetoin utilization deacetylase AcuC-like enzyme
MQVSEKGFAAMTAALCNLAREACGGRIIFLLKGGYHLRALADSVHAVVEELL